MCAIPAGRSGIWRRGVLTRQLLATFLCAALTASHAYALDLPAYVHIGLVTTFTLERHHHPAVLGAVAVFPLKKNLYASLPADKPINAFELVALNVTLPALPGAPGLAVSGTLAYRTSQSALAVTLCNFSGQLSTIRREVSCTPAPGFSTFEATLRHDVTTTDPNARTLDKVLFVVSVTANGDPLAAAQVQHLDVDVSMQARITTRVEI